MIYGKFNDGNLFLKLTNKFAADRHDDICFISTTSVYESVLSIFWDFCSKVFNDSLKQTS